MNVIPDHPFYCPPCLICLKNNLIGIRQQRRARRYFPVDLLEYLHARVIFGSATLETPEGTNFSRWNSRMVRVLPTKRDEARSRPAVNCQNSELPGCVRQAHPFALAAKVVRPSKFPDLSVVIERVDACAQSVAVIRAGR